MNDISIIILAAGKGTRMKSSLPKVMHKVANREMLNLVIDEAKKLDPTNISIVVSQEMSSSFEDILKEHPQTNISFTLQKERKGTAHATETGLKNIKKLGSKVLVLYGDTPLVCADTLNKMLDKIEKSSVCVLGFECAHQNAYGKLVVSKDDNLERIIEDKDASEEEKAITLCNSGVMAIDAGEIVDLLKSVENNNAPKEFYLTDIIGIAASKNLKRSYIRTNEEEVLGVNSRSELAQVEQLKQNQLRNEVMKNGATLIDPNSTFFAFDTKLSSDVIIHPNVVFGPKVEIKENVEIKSFSHIEGALIDENSVIGPFARIRPGSKLAKNVKIGNFVEVKNSRIDEEAKINHLSYVGDSDVGSSSNIGAGTITCNYNGYAKSKTKIGDNVFIGSNTALIAPVEIKDGAIVAAGSTITKNVEKNDLAVARSKQIAIIKGGESFRQKNNDKAKK